MSNQVDFDEYTENYNELLHEQTRFFASSDEYFASYKVNIVKENATSQPARILEYGCGIGRNIPFLQAAFPSATIVGSDISAGSIELAQKTNPGIEFFVESETVQTRERFDLIFVAGVFHHIPPSLRAGVVATLSQRLNQNGSVFVFEHNPYNPVTRRLVSTCPYDEDAVLLAPKDLSRLLAEGGFSVEKKEYCLFVPPRFSSLLWLEKRLSWLPMGGQYWVQAVRSK